MLFSRDEHGFARFSYDFGHFSVFTLLALFLPMMSHCFYSLPRTFFGERTMAAPLSPSA